MNGPSRPIAPRRPSCLAWLGLLPLALLAADTARGQVQVGELTYSRQGSFAIPFKVEAGDRRIQEVQLHVSEDMGRTWRRYSSATPQGAARFNFQTDRDGLYWFTVQTVDREGRAYPSRLEGTAPQLKVVVDTQTPLVVLRPAAAPAGQVGVEWLITDDNLDLNTLFLEYQLTGGGEWMPLGVERQASGRKAWSPQTNAAMTVRLRARDRAGNEGQASAPVSLGGTAAASPVPPAGSGAAGAGRQGAETVRYVNSTRISLNYELKDVGPSGVSVVELHYTQDGRNWQRYKEEPGGRPPFVVDVNGEGLYGFTLVARSKVGLGESPPKVGDLPQVWVEVDLTKPDVQLRGVDVGRGPDSGNLTITWTAADKHLGRQPITLAYAERPEGPWTEIASGLENNGRFVWRMPPGVPFSFLVRVEAADRAGNVGSAQSDPARPVLVDLAVPKVQVLAVEPVSKQ